MDDGGSSDRQSGGGVGRAVDEPDARTPEVGGTSIHSSRSSFFGLLAS